VARDVGLRRVVVHVCDCGGKGWKRFGVGRVEEGDMRRVGGWG
jgi:hypothetical protein